MTKISLITLIMLQSWSICATSKIKHHFLPPIFSLDHLKPDFGQKAAPQLLSESSLYLDIANKIIDPRNKSYEPQYPLWSDGAEKKRWIYLPPGQQINSSDMDRWDFPIGTKIWKEFSFKENGVGRKKIVETRMIEKIASNHWTYASYIWDDDENEARLAPSTGKKNVFPIADGMRHDVPSITSCIRCHKQGKDPVLSFQALQLAHDSPKELNLDKLIENSLLSHNPLKKPEIISRNRLGQEAMGYLHANCGGCHNASGNAESTGLYLQHRIADTKSEADEAVFINAVNKLCSDFEIPGQDETYYIKAGDISRSAIWYRMHERGKHAAMPPIGTKLVDNFGLLLVGQWIISLGIE